MVNPVKAFNRATGLSNVLDKGTAANTEALRQSGLNQSQGLNADAPPPSAPPLVGQDAAPKRQTKAPRQFAPAIIGSGASTGETGGKTLLGQ